LNPTRTPTTRRRRCWFSVSARSGSGCRPRASRTSPKNGRCIGCRTAASGTLHPAFNLRELLELPDEAPEGITLSRRVYPRMLLFRREQQAFAFGADEVFGIAPLDQDQLQPVPATVSKALATFTRGLFPFNECSVGLLDDELLEHSLTRQHLNL
jgi:chemotaxis signal transduction protein